MRRVIIFLFVWATAVYVFAQQDFRLTPEDKSFAVNFPSQPDHQQNESNSGLIHIEAHAYSVENSSWRFLLSYVQLTPLPTDLKPSDALDGAIGATVKNVEGKLLSEESIRVSGRPAKAVKISAGESTTVDGRFVYAGPRVYQLLVVHPNEVTPPFERQFFDSFTITTAEVIDVFVRATAIDYFGPCPVMVHFRGIVRVSRVPLTLRYYWERSSGKVHSKSIELAADAIPQFEVADDFAVGMTGQRFGATDRLHVLTDDGEVVSDTVKSVGHCK